MTTKADPRLGTLVPTVAAATTTLPGGMTSTTSSIRNMEKKLTLIPGIPETDQRNFKLVDTVTVCERTTRSTYDFDTRELVVTSPLGRESRSRKDLFGRLVEASPRASTR